MKRATDKDDVQTLERKLAEKEDECVRLVLANNGLLKENARLREMLEEARA